MFRDHPDFLALQDDLDKEREQILAYSRQIGDLNAELNDCDAEISNLSEENKELRRQIKELEYQIKELESRLEVTGRFLAQIPYEKLKKMCFYCSDKGQGFDHKCVFHSAGQCYSNKYCKKMVLRPVTEDKENGKDN